MCLSRQGCSWPWTGAEKIEGARRGTLLGEAQVMGSGMYREGRGVKGDGGEGKERARNGLEQGGMTRSVLGGIHIAPLYLR